MNVLIKTRTVVNCLYNSLLKVNNISPSTHRHSSIRQLQFDNVQQTQEVELLTSLTKEVIDRCRERRWKIGIAESCTGGLVSGSLTALAGSSDVVDCGFLTYSNDAKIRLLGVPSELLASVGAVSHEVALSMADGVLNKVPAVHLAVSITGIAGPGGGSDTKPVGLVYFGLACRGYKTLSSKHIFSGDRTTVRQSSVFEALTLLLNATRY